MDQIIGHITSVSKSDATIAAIVFAVSAAACFRWLPVRQNFGTIVQVFLICSVIGAGAAPVINAGLTPNLYASLNQSQQVRFLIHNAIDGLILMAVVFYLFVLLAGAFALFSSVFGRKPHHHQTATAS